MLSALATEFVGARSRSPALLLSSHEQDDCIIPDEPGKNIVKVQFFWANVKRLQWPFQSRKSGHFEPRICGHLIPRLTDPLSKPKAHPVIGIAWQPQVGEGVCPAPALGDLPTGEQKERDGVKRLPTSA